jgi:Plasmid pRiA4b ORF-3-like protein
MATPTAAAASSASSCDQIYELKITLLHTHPPIWRRVQVPATLSLSKLHCVIQFAMGWRDAHLYNFEIQGRTYAQSLCYNLPPLWYRLDQAERTGVSLDDDEDDDLAKFKLHQVLKGEGFKFKYHYDFGDNWYHEMCLERILLRDERRALYPVCTAGQRACPPEDCGGVYGYAQLVPVLENVNHPLHERLTKQWVRKDTHFDASHWDMDAANAKLSVFQNIPSCPGAFHD